jgi:DNA-binding helix-hairpin-helix protein with protein kinase domain
MTWLDGSDIDKKELSVGDKLGTGGQGDVFDLLDQGAGYVYKAYKSSAVNGEALAELAALPRALTGTERTRLLRQSAWPLARVVDAGRVTGFVMRKVPKEFWDRTTAGPQLRELQYLLYEPKPLWGDITPLDAAGRLEVARQAAALFFLLHAKGLVMGDVSMRNLLWASSPTAIFLLDCDGFRTVGSQPVLDQTHTPDWNDPHQPAAGPDLDSDRYKLALLVGRVLTKAATVRPGEPLTFVPGLPERITTAVAARFADAGQARGLRPDAGQWMRALDDRGSIDLPPLPPLRPRPNLPKTPMDGKRGPRPTIPLSPPSI